MFYRVYISAGIYPPPVCGIGCTSGDVVISGRTPTCDRETELVVEPFHGFFVFRRKF